MSRPACREVRPGQKPPGSALPGVLALTGGMGSGKSYVSAVFEAAGFPVYDADSRTKALYIKNKDLQKDLCRLLGEDILCEGGLDFKLMAARIFAGPDLLEATEALVFPRVMEDFSAWWKRWAEAVPAPAFVVMESAIILQKPCFKPLIDRVLTVSSPQELRIERVMNRSGLSREEALARIQKQWDDRRREEASDFVIVSDSQRALLPQICAVTAAMEEVMDGKLPQISIYLEI